MQHSIAFDRCHSGVYTQSRGEPNKACRLQLEQRCFCATKLPHGMVWFACFLWALIATPFAAAATEILVLQSHDSLPYQQTLSGFQAYMRKDNLDVAYQTLTVSQPNSTATLSQTLQNGRPKLILTLGTPATRMALTLVTDIPVVASLVLDTDEIRQYRSATAVGLNFSAELQWQWLRRLLPNAREIAVLRAPKPGNRLFESLGKLAQAEGINLFWISVEEGENLPKQIESLPPQLDALWAIDGSTAYSASTVRELLLYSFRNRVPLIGLSAQWVKAGALYALDWDYGDLGAQAASLAEAILLKNTPPSALPPLSPRTVRPVFNPKTAEHMKLAIPENWRAHMVEVFP